MTTGSLEQRVAHLEGAYQHLATKADLRELEGKLYQMESRLLRWLVGTILASVGMASGITLALNRLLNS
ncbi:MAG: hypothetical protein F4185_04700 [Chloroflexi bacterium]|nr:hypothetical protein [Chloroflexota bacterium]MXY59499.1 hypothetical protein [Chloroflexota bacterium]MYA50860.1 hypothetical protein [Chloroflexota bacterium]MYF65222.1 hypothetical protein [Chloroflexota bacterium]MYK34681.1 hypothetical protein [Chloroflexota bacterium]